VWYFVFMHITLAFMAIIYVLNHDTENSEKNLFKKVYESSVESGRARFFSQQNQTLISSENIAFASCDIILTIVHSWID